jgi:hypothetical protein
MSQKGIQPETQSIGGVEREYIYDVQETKKGRIWFKLPKK